MTTLYYNNFTRGCLDEDLSGRFDLPVFNNGFPLIKNFISNYKGNLKYRTGFEYVAQTKDNSVARLMQFKFNTEQAYLMVMTPNIITFYTYDSNGDFGGVNDTAIQNDIPVLSSNKQGGYIISDARGNSDIYTVINGTGSKAIGNWSTYWLQVKYPAPYVVKQYSIRADNNGSPEYPSSWNLLASNNGSDWVVVDSRKNQTFSLSQTKTFSVLGDVRYSYYRLKFTSGVHSSGNGEIGKVTFSGYIDPSAILQIVTGANAEQNEKMVKAQNADVMYLTSENYPPQKLTRKSANSFTIENVSADGIDFTSVGFPSSCCFYKGRLWYGGFTKKPTTIKGSKVINYDHFTIPSSDKKDDDALSLMLSDISDPISWIYGGKSNLIVGNPEGISVVNGGETGKTITSKDVNADLANKEGAFNSIPTEKDGKMIYISSDRNRVFSFDYDLISESFKSSSLNLLKETVGDLRELHYKKGVNNLVFGRLGNGQMVTLLYNPEENIIGWYNIETDGFVHSMCTVTRPDGYDDLYICVERNGNMYIERMCDEVAFTSFYQTDYENDETKEKYNRIQMEELKKCIYLDGAVRLSNEYMSKITINGDRLVSDDKIFTEDFVGHYIVYKTKTGAERGEMFVTEFINSGELKVNTMSRDVSPLSYDSWYLTFNKISDLDDVEGQKQTVFADGGYIGEFVVQNGEVDLGGEYTVATVGYPYTGLVKTFNCGPVTQNGNAQTMKKRIAEFVLRFVNSSGFEIGTDINNMQQTQLFSPSGFYDMPPLLANGDVRVLYNDNHANEKCVYMRQQYPLPCVLTMLEYKLNVEALE